MPSFSVEIGIGLTDPSLFPFFLPSSVFSSPPAIHHMHPLYLLPMFLHVWSVYTLAIQHIYKFNIYTQIFNFLSEDMLRLTHSRDHVTDHRMDCVDARPALCPSPPFPIYTPRTPTGLSHVKINLKTETF